MVKFWVSFDIQSAPIFEISIPFGSSHRAGNEYASPCFQGCLVFKLGPPKVKNMIFYGWLFILYMPRMIKLNLILEFSRPELSKSVSISFISSIEKYLFDFKI